MMSFKTTCKIKKLHQENGCYSGTSFLFWVRFLKMQMSMFAVNVKHEVDSATLGLDGMDLKRVAHCDDGYDYAMKRLEDHPSLPISEWVSYCLFKACGLLVPDYAVLRRVGLPPAFGSRLATGSTQIQKTPDSYQITTYFSGHHNELGAIYPVDAFLPNPDRHGRNFLKREAALGESLIAFDFSRAWVMSGLPFGDEGSLTDSRTAQWWKYFVQYLKIKADYTALDKIINQLDDNWLSTVIKLAPSEWVLNIDMDKANEFWIKSRADRVIFAKNWTK